MCSTPFGVEGSITGRIVGNTRRALVLNAFRRRRFHHCPAGLRRRSLLVLNAFRRRRFHHRRSASTRSLGHECSTPFGVEGSITRHAATVVHPYRCMCSTPFGVEGSITPRCSTFPRRTMSAQRLSASKVPSLLRARSWPQDRMCSTPFGVEGSITRHIQPQRPVRQEVLNAFRRRRFHHGWSLRPSCTSSSAQRLSASKVPSPRSVWTIATRPYVLNAFRRRRFHHGRCQGRALRARGVLNAFRRRRFHHRTTCSPCAGSSGCAQRLSASKVPSPEAGHVPALDSAVLNAFRRRRFHHVGGMMFLAELLECSTPFGVEGSITRRQKTEGR